MKFLMPCLRRKWNPKMWSSDKATMEIIFMSLSRKFASFTTLYIFLLSLVRPPACANCVECVDDKKTINETFFSQWQLQCICRRRQQARPHVWESWIIWWISFAVQYAARCHNQSGQRGPAVGIRSSDIPANSFEIGIQKAKNVRGAH